MKRRTRTRAPGIFKSSSGSYEIAYRDDGGSLRFKTTGTDFEAAKAARAEMVSRRAKGERIVTTSQHFADFAQAWLEAQTQLRPRTREWYEIAIRKHLTPRLGRKRLAEIREDDIVRVIREMECAGAAGWTIRGVLTPLGRILNHAARRGLIPSNPLTRLERNERPSVDRSEMRILGREEIAKLSATAPKRYAAILATALLTGARLGELLGLKWADVDFAAGVLRVRRQADRQGNLAPPKTKRASRDIVLAPQLAMLLREHRLASRFSADGDFVFASATSGTMNGRNVSRRGLDKALEAAELGKLRFHDLRHT